MEGTFSVRPSVCFEVQKITAVSIGEGNQRNYQVQWAPTWISSVHLVGCEHLIEEFICQQSEKGELVDSTITPTETDSFQDDLKPDAFEADFTKQYPYKEDIYKRASMVVSDDCLFNNPERNSSSYNNENIRVIPVSNGGMVTDDLYVDNDKNPNFEWVQNLGCTSSDQSSPVYIDPVVVVNGECNFNKKSMQKEELKQSDLFCNNRLDIKTEEITMVTESKSAQTELGDVTEYKDGVLKNSSKKLYKCNVCFEVFKNISALTQHSNRIHGIIFKCAICHRKFASKSNLVKHKLKHSKGKHKCHICSKVFLERDKLISHVQTHSHRPHQCNFCEKKFLTNTDLIRHTRVHTNERPFECLVCKKRFKVNHHLQAHVRTHKEVKPEKASIT